MGQLGGPPLLIQRRSQPMRFRTVVAFFYAIIVGMIVFAALIPAQRG